MMLYIPIYTTYDNTLYVKIQYKHTIIRNQANRIDRRSCDTKYGNEIDLVLMYSYVFLYE